MTEFAPKDWMQPRSVLAGPPIPKAEAGETPILSDLDACAHDGCALDGIPARILVRPDGRIAFRDPAERPELLRSYCERMFGIPPPPAG